MWVVLSVVNRFFDLFFRPFESRAPLWGLLVVSLLTGLLMVAVFRYASDQRALRRVKDRIKANLLAVQLFQDNLGVVWRAHGQVLRSTLSYLRLTLRPLAVMLIPLVLILVQLEMRFGQLPLRPKEDFLLVARLTEATLVEDVSLRLPEGVQQVAPPLRLPSEREVNWRLRAEQYGEYEVEVVAGGQRAGKQVIVSRELARLSVKRVRAGLSALLYPGERPLPRESPFEAIEVRYRPRSVNLGLVAGHWLIAFLVFSLLAGFLLKGPLGTEI